MAKPPVAKIKPQKAPYVTPRISSFKVDPKRISTDIDRLADLQRQAQQEQEVKIGWKEYLAVAIGSIFAYRLSSDHDPRGRA